MAKNKAAPKSPLKLVHTKRQRCEILFATLEAERSTHRTYWRDLLDYVNPQRGRFTVTDSGKGTRKNQKIINSRASDDLTILKAGMMATITNPTTQWVRLTVEDKEIAENGEAKAWLGDTSKIINDIILKSNTYRNLPIVYGDMATVAIGALLVEEDFDDVIRTYPIPIGSYMVAVDDKGRVNTYAREFRYTVQEVVMKFGIPNGEPFVLENINWDNISSKVKDLWERSEHLAWVDVVHMVMPNMDYNPDKLDAKYKRFASVYYERGSSGTLSARDNRDQAGVSQGLFLRESGLDMFNILVPRWETTGEDAYGTNCPAMKCHGDSRSTQTMEKRKSQAHELQVNPAMIFPVSMRKKKNSTLAGSRLFADAETMRGGGIRKAFEFNFDSSGIREDIREAEMRIDAAFHRDAFAPISGQPIQGTPPSAAEVNARLSESRLKLLGANQNIQDDLLEPFVDLVFFHANNQGKIPEPPKILEEMELKVEFIGVMAQAQKAIALGSLREFTDYALMLASVEPSAMDKIDTDQLLDEYHEGAGISTKIIISDEEVLEKRLEQQQAMQAQQQMEQMQAMAGTAKDLSQADMSGDNALSAITEGLAE